MTLDQWAADWHIAPAALADLYARMRLQAPAGVVAAPVKPGSEAGAQQRVRLQAAREGVVLWRNNVGAAQLADGSFIRWGLANDSSQLNERFKSADLVGIRPVLVGPEHVGRTLGVFVSREVKAPGWRYTATPRELAQKAWADLILAHGGDAAFTTGGL